MHSSDWLRLVAIVGLLVVAILSVTRGARNPLARRLALLAIDIGGINVVAVVNHVTGACIGQAIDAVLSAMAPALALDFAVTFVGGARPARRATLAAYTLLGALAAASSVAYFSPSGREWIEGPGWSAMFLALCIPALAYTLVLLVLHLRTVDPREKARTRLLLAAFAVGGTLDTADVVTWATEHANYDTGALGTLIAVGLVAIVVFRLRLFEEDLSASAALYAVAMAGAAVALYIVVFRTLSDRLAPLVLATACVTVVGGFAVRELVESNARQRAQRERLAVLGRFAAQMAHDVKNPLAAISGAARLAEDVAVDASQLRFLQIVVEQAARIAAIIDKYDRLGRIEPVRVRTSVGDLVRRAASAQTLAAPDVRFSLDIASEDGTRAMIDEDLVSGAIENLVRNAVEAMPAGGAVVLRVARQGEHVVVRVEDDGEGMDPRRAARAFDDFFTTKANGSGLGLAFVRRVAQAHGGDVAMTSRLGRGTAVELRLPVTGEAPGG